MFTGNKKTLLLHSCCAPCSTSVLERLTEVYKVILYFYNPNIMPAAEYEKRLSEQKRLASILDIALIEGDNDNEVFLKAVRGLENEQEGGKRCEKCIAMRLFKTAETSKAQGFDFFATTLSVSPHKNTGLINRILKEAGENSIREDFKKKDGYKRSTELSKMHGLYRQNYCGCIFT